MKGTSAEAADRRKPPVIRLNRRERMAILAAWTGLGLLEAAKAWVSTRFTPNPADLATVLVGNLPWWLMWAGLTPLVIAIARRFRPDRGRWSPWIVHFAAAVVLSLGHHLVVGTLYFYTHTRGGVFPVAGEWVQMTLPIQFRNFFAAYFVLNVLTYFTTAAAYYGIEFYKRYREGELRAARLEAGMHRARLQALRMELNPHFLFNTLNAIAGLVRRREHDAAVRMLARLSELLRSTLEQASDPEVPLDRELDLLRSYLEIERIRFGGRLTVEVQTDPDVRDALVPPLILQPLVENAVRHGVARQAGPGRIAVAATGANGDLVLSVSNSGPAGKPGARGAAGIGLANTRERLMELYGGRGRLLLELLPEGGARAEVRLPLRLGEEDATVLAFPTPAVAGP